MSFRIVSHRVMTRHGMHVEPIRRSSPSVCKSVSMVLSFGTYIGARHPSQPARRPSPDPAQPTPSTPLSLAFATHDPRIASHAISSHLISSHLIPSHLISSRFVPPRPSHLISSHSPAGLGFQLPPRRIAKYATMGRAGRRYHGRGMGNGASGRSTNTCFLLPYPALPCHALPCPRYMSYLPSPRSQIPGSPGVKSPDRLSVCMYGPRIGYVGM